MVFNPRREEEKLEADLAKIRATTRMRLGVVAGVVIIGLMQTKFQPVGGDLFTAASTLLQTALPVIFIAAAGVLFVVGLAWRDMRRARAAYESKRFRVPKRRPAGKA